MSDMYGQIYGKYGRCWKDGKIHIDSEIQGMSDKIYETSDKIYKMIFRMSDMSDLILNILCRTRFMQNQIA